MRNFRGLALVFGAIAALQACAAGQKQPAFSPDETRAPHPWLSEDFDAGGGKFTFAVISDLNGGEREGVFAAAVDQLNLLRPDFVISVGDLIDGASEEPSSLEAEWDWFDERASKLRAPFFHVGGNHDLTGEALREFWKARYGAPYYSFVYRDALFLVLDTEDNTPERMREMFEARSAAIKMIDSGQPGKAQQMEYYRMPERVTGAIGPEQAAYFENAIAAHPDVRWTFLFMHKPIWQADDPDFARVEAALAGRPYTLFNGHLHAYSLSERNGRDYIMLGTTGGGQDAANDNSFDHVTLVTLDDSGPSIANLKLDGILDKSAKLPNGAETMCFQASRCAKE